MENRRRMWWSGWCDVVHGHGDRARSECFCFVTSDASVSGEQLIPTFHLVSYSLGQIGESPPMKFEYGRRSGF